MGSLYNNTWTIQTDIDSVNEANIGKYVEIKEKKHNTPITFTLYDKGKTMDAQFVTIAIDENSLNRNKIQKLFEDDKLELNVLIHEEPFPVIYGGRLSDKGPIIGEVNLQHFIYQI